MTTAAAGLSKRERALLADWERARKKSVSLTEIAELVGSGSARVVASTLVRKGALDRLRPGLYAIRPMRAMARPWMIPAFSAVELLLAGEPHYIGGLGAFTLHRLTQQVYHSRVDAFVTKYRRPRVMMNADIVFHRRKLVAFESGLTRIEMEGVKLVVSDPERTVLDALDHPPLVGDMSVAIAHFKNALPRIDPARLADYALRLAADSTCQRLGLLLERAEVRGPFMADLRQRASSSTGQHLLVPGYPRSGPLHPVWRVVENEPRSSVSVHEQW